MPESQRANQREAYPTPKISVIVPIYNTEAYIEKCLRSIMAQTLSEIEIICVDDASPDQSAAIVERLAREDVRISLIRHARNRGLGGARNTGIAAARAAFVIGVDSDDWIKPDLMTRLWEASGEGAADIATCGMAVVSDDEKVLFNVSFPEQTYQNDSNEVMSAKSTRGEAATNKMVAGLSDQSSRCRVAGQPTASWRADERVDSRCPFTRLCAS